MAEVPEDLQNLDEQLSDTYFCNFSLFQSIPDSWAIKQLFPVMPIHRLNEKPRQSRRPRRHHLRLRRQARSLRRPPRRQEDAAAAHASTATPYYLGVFLVGAYQEILGDLHNLFGDTHAVHVSLDEQRRGAPRHADQGRHRARGARLRGVRRRDAARQAAHRRRDRRARRAASTTKAPAGCSASTKTACTAIPTWKAKSSMI